MIQHFGKTGHGLGVKAGTAGCRLQPGYETKPACSKTGFTLVEIMIVVAIIGLLAAIAVPSLKKARQTTQLNVCLNNLRIYQDALDQYAHEFGEFPDDISALVTEGYLPELYACRVGGAYEWRTKPNKREYHLKCGGQHTPSIDHVCIHENQPPTAKD